MCTHVHISSTKWCIEGDGTDALRDSWIRSILLTHKYSAKTRTRACLLMPWLTGSPDHQQPRTALIIRDKGTILFQDEQLQIPAHQNVEDNQMVCFKFSELNSEGFRFRKAIVCWCCLSITCKAAKLQISLKSILQISNGLNCFIVFGMCFISST